MTTIKESFVRHEHPFDYVIDIIKLIRSLKADFNINAKEVGNTTIVVKNEYELAALIQSAKEIKNLCKIKTLFIDYCDDVNVNNNLYFKF